MYPPVASRVDQECNCDITCEISRLVARCMMTFYKYDEVPHSFVPVALACLRRDPDRRACITVRQLHVKRAGRGIKVLS